MDTSQGLAYRPETPPPQYLDTEVVPAVTEPNQSLMHLASFEDVMVLYEYEDSIRLPTYQSRPLWRYHPYWRVRPVTPVCDGITRYYNTVFDESYEALEVPPLNVPTVPTAGLELAGNIHPREVAEQLEVRIPPAPIGLPPLPPVEHVENENPFSAVVDVQEQHQLRIHRLWHLIPEFLVIVMRAIEAVTRGMEHGVPGDAPGPVNLDEEPNTSVQDSLTSAAADN
ncbi:hypothetical protein H0H81_011397 [Sphagnurus paluster]|uniref:Uncharacterized protein n=1 Tax=Sphagnurus paluster TaxID=117069 RepID=A0A9P7GPE9_9AGAR|nr:hypothetical protein H0H81_011397 [Sphagnurus paluster]